MSIDVTYKDPELRFDTRIYGEPDPKTGLCAFERYITWSEACELFEKIMDNIQMCDPDRNVPALNRPYSLKESCEWYGPMLHGNYETSEKPFDYHFLSAAVREGNESPIINILGFNKEARHYETLFKMKLFTDNLTLGKIIIALYEHISYGRG